MLRVEILGFVLVFVVGVGWFLFCCVLLLLAWFALLGVVCVCVCVCVFGVVVCCCLVSRVVICV